MIEEKVKEERRREEIKIRNSVDQEVSQIIQKLKIENEELKLRVSQLEVKEMTPPEGNSNLFELDLNLDFNKFKNNFEYKTHNLNSWVERLNEFFLTKIESLENKCKDISSSYTRLSRSRDAELQESNRRIKFLEDELKRYKESLAKNEELDIANKIKEGFGSFRDTNNLFVSERNNFTERKEANQQKTSHKTDIKGTDSGKVSGLIS